MNYRFRSQRRQNHDEPGHAHELTFSCYHRFRFLQADRTCRWLAEAIEQARQRLGFAVWAYIFMPEHVHLIVCPLRADYCVSAILKAIKQPVGMRAMRYLEEYAPHWLPKVTRVRAGRTERLFWQSGGGYDRNIIEPETLMMAVDYIHLNPVRRLLVERPSEWTWSSAGWFEGEEKNLLRPDPIPAEWSV